MIKSRTGVDVGTLWETNGYGTLRVLAYNGCNSVEVEFLNTLSRRTVQASQIKSKKVKDFSARTVYGVGFIGYGKWSTTKCKKARKAAKKWRSMIKRCYSGFPHYHTYKDVSVCDEWLNLQIFTDWFIKNHPDDGLDYDLDKDLKDPSKRMYSPETCSFINRSEHLNLTFRKPYKLKSPKGTVISGLNLTQFCKENNLHQGAMWAVNNGSKAHYKGWTKAD